MSDVQQRIDDLVKGNRVVLFMKGTAQFPMCGFSGRAIQILKACGVDDLKTVNVLEDEDIRQGIKDYANWPTIPQLYVNGEFVGGSDIMMEMYQAASCSRCWHKRLTVHATPRLVVGITGATGAVYGVRLLQRARALGVRDPPGGHARPACSTRTTNWAWTARALEALADHAYAPGDVGACMASGSFDTAAMVVAPCSMKTLAAVAHGFGDNLLTRAADVTLKERRPPAADGARDAVQPGPPAQHDRRHRDGRHRLPAAAGLLPPAAEHRRDGRRHASSACWRCSACDGAAPQAWAGSDGADRRLQARRPARRPTAAARAEHRVRVLGPAAAAVVAAQRQEQVAALDVEVVAQDHAAEAQVGLHVEQPRRRRRRRSARAQNGITCM